ncbi:MAG: class I SAM-dependent methyltransferase [Bacteriovoracaceae bacterium]
MNYQEVWDQIFLSKSWGKYPPEALLRFVGRNYIHKGNVKGVKALELGCGPGSNIWFLSREGFEAYGVDISPVAISKANERLKSEGLTAQLVTGSITNLPYENDYFDFVIDNACVYCLNEASTKIVMKEVHRVLKKGGLFFSITFADDTTRGEGFTTINDLEFKDAKVGTFANAGYVRLASKEKIHEIYGEDFEIKSIEKLRLSNQDESHTISHWIVTVQKA